MADDQIAVLNGDDAMLKDFHPRTKRITYGMNEDNDFVAKDVENLGIDGLRCTLHHHGQSFEAKIPAFGVHMIYAALAGATVGWALGMTDGEIAEGISRYQTVGDRARVLKTEKYTIISDCYNANPSSTAAAIDSLNMLSGRRVCILGDMLELGENTEALHAQVGRKAAETGVDLIVACGALSKHTFEGAEAAGGHAVWFAAKSELIAKLPEILKDGDSILVKASHSCAFEEITKILAEK